VGDYSALFDYYSDAPSKERIQALAEQLRKCISCLIDVMDSNLAAEDIMAPEMSTVDMGAGHVLIRMLEEVVKSC